MINKEKFEDLLMTYFSIGVAQGKEGRDHDDAEYSAQETHLKLMEAWQTVNNSSHVINEFADELTNALQWLKNIRDGYSTAEEGITETKKGLDRCLELSRQLGDCEICGDGNITKETRCHPESGVEMNVSTCSSCELSYYSENDQIETQNTLNGSLYIINKFLFAAPRRMLIIDGKETSCYVESEARQFAKKISSSLSVGFEKWITENSHTIATDHCNGLCIRPDELRAYFSDKVIISEDATKEMIDAAERVDWSNEDTRASIINMWQVMIDIAKKNER